MRLVMTTEDKKVWSIQMFFKLYCLAMFMFSIKVEECAAVR